MKTNPYHMKSAFLLAACLFTASTAGAVTMKYTNSDTFTPPSGVTSVTVEVWGGGGAGGSAQKSTVNSAGGGGGGGAYAKLINVPVTPGTPYTVTIPAIVQAPASGFATGDRVNGADVTFTGDGGVSVTASGGMGGASSVNKDGSNQQGAGAAAGSGFTLSWAGGNPAPAITTNGGGGGAGASDLSNGKDSPGNNNPAPITLGSDVDHNGGAGGNGITGGNDGGAAAAPGGGGGGARASATGIKRGGAGGKGQILISFSGATVVKANNSLDLSGGSSWVGGNAPDSATTAKWDNTVTSANTTDLGADLTWGGINIANPTGLVTINSGNTLTLNGGIDMSAAISDLTMNNDLVLGGSAVWPVAASHTLTLGGVVSGNFNLTMPGPGKVIFSGANTYSGATAINGGTLQLGASDVIPNGVGKGNVTVPGTLDLNGFSETVNGLSGPGTVDNTATGTTSTLTVGGNDITSTFGGVMQNSGSGSKLNLTKIGSGQLTLAGVNTLGGTVTVTGGNLTVANPTPLDNITGLSIGNIELGLSANATISAPITLSGNATIVAQAAGMVLTNLNGPIGGTGNLSFTTVTNSLSSADSKVLIGAAGTFAGNVAITTQNALNNMTVRVGAENALPTTSVVTLGTAAGSSASTRCDLDLFGYNQKLAGLTNITGTARLQRVYNSGANTATLTINNAADYTFAGTLGKAGGNDFSLTKSGAGTFTLSGANTYTGTTSVTEGALVLSGTAIPNGNSLSVTGTGTVSVTGAGTETVGSLTIGLTTYTSGAYTSANTGGVITSGTIQVGAAAGYAAWQAANGTAQTINMDHDSDGVSNGIEFFLYGPVDTTGFTPLPAVTNTAGSLSITFTKAAGYSGTYGTDFVVETSATLAPGSWVAAPANVTPGTADTVTIAGNNVTYTFAAGAKNFARLNVTGP